MSTRMTTNRRQEALGTLHVLPDEIICAIVEDLSPRDVGRLSCLNSVFYTICNEEPLWMRLCLHNFQGELDYKVSWKQTAKEILQLTRSDNEVHQKIPFSEGFSSLFLYRRWYRCRITLDNFVFDKGDIERIHDISNEDFLNNYDGKKPVLFTGLANDWNANRNWTLENLTERYGELAFRISQSSAKSITMKLKNYVSYMKQQHDEDPLYIFDAKFGEAAPALLEDYDVPHLFQEDFFSPLEDSQRPPYRWLVIGPSRSGASWHVDPTLTSAWNTLLQGRKRWALYPPCKVPPGVTVHVNEDDGDVNIESPSSLQWWLDIYPLLAEEDKPIECTQLPGETIYVPSGWWHCVLNIDASIAVTQNFVNEKNFEFVCLDLAPGHLHKGVARSGWLALEDRCGGIKDGKMTRANDCLGVDVEYSVESLSSYLDENRNQYSSKFCEGNVLSPKDVREWLHKLWVSRPEMRDLTWKGADIVLNARKWLDAVIYICTANCLPVPIDSEKLPVGHGSNPVYVVGDYVIKLYVEEGVEASMFSLGSELEFHDLLIKLKSPLINHVPHIVASGILCFNGESYESVLWNGKGVPSILERYNLFSEGSIPPDYCFSTWNKMHAISKTSGDSADDTSNVDRPVWPYVVARRCQGEDFAHVREKLSKHDYLDLASFLGQQVRHLHSLPLPPLPASSKRMKLSNGCKVNGTSSCSIPQDNGASFSSANCYNCTPQGSCYKDFQLPAEWELFIGKIRKQKDNVKERLRKWNDCPGHLIEEAEGYLPQDPTLLLNIHAVENGILKVLKTPRWLHMDIMDDNIQMEPYPIAKFVDDHSLGDSWIPTANNNVELEGGGIKEQAQRIFRPSCLLDFSDLCIGDPIYELLAIYIDVFRGNNDLLKQFLSSYRLPFFERIDGESFTADYSSEKLSRLSYHAMCYCILHEDNVMGAIFSIWKELKKAKSWEEIEMTVWGKLNYFEASY